MRYERLSTENYVEQTSMSYNCISLLLFIDIKHTESRVAENIRCQVTRLRDPSYMTKWPGHLGHQHKMKQSFFLSSPDRTGRGEQRGRATAARDSSLDRRGRGEQRGRTTAARDSSLDLLSS